MYFLKTTSVSADILNVIQKIGAEVHVEGRHSAVEETDVSLAIVYVLVLFFYYVL